MECEGFKAPRTRTRNLKDVNLSGYHYLSEYPPCADIEYELTWDGHRFVGIVPGWAHDKWLSKSQHAVDPDGGKRPSEDHPNSASANAAAAAASGGKLPLEDHPNSASATAAAASGTKAPKRHLKARAEIPSETVAAYAEVIALDPALAYTYPDVYAYHRDPDRYAFVAEGCRVVYKLDKWAGLGDLPVPGFGSDYKFEAGFFPPKPRKEDPSAGAKVETKPKGNL